MYRYAMLTAASCSASGLHTVFLGLALYIYIYMQHRLSARAYMAIYAYMQGIYAYMEPGKHIYKPYIYVSMFICVFLCKLHAEYMQMSAI